MAAEDPKDTLVDLGLTPSEARVYLRLIETRGARVTDIARLAGLPRSRAYAVVASLAARGLAVELPGVYKRFEAVDLGTAIDRLVAERRRRIDLAAERAASLRESAPRIQPARVDEEAGAVLARLIPTAEREVLVQAMRGDLAPAAWAPALRTLPNVRVRVITEREPDHPLAALPGAEVRARAALRASVVVVDREAVLLRGRDDPVGGLLVARNRTLAGVLAEAFEAAWAAAEEPARAVARARDP